MEELIESMGDRIKLTEGERKGITIIEFYTADLRARSECCLLGRLISDRRIQKEAFKALMTRLWKTLEAVAFKELLDNLLLLEFPTWLTNGVLRRVTHGSLTAVFWS
jgi:hypothetical protein